MATDPLIRALDPAADLPALTALYQEAADFWTLTEGRAPDAAMVADFFTDTAPDCDPAAAHRLGLFAGPRLIGAALLDFGWPNPCDAYLGLMFLAPAARGQGLGPRFLAEIETRARAARAPALSLGVLDWNIHGRAFWRTHGFTPTGIRRQQSTGAWAERMTKPL